MLDFLKWILLVIGEIIIGIVMALGIILIVLFMIALVYDVVSRIF